MAEAATDAGTPKTPPRAGWPARRGSADPPPRGQHRALVALGLIVYFSVRTEAFFGSDNARVIAEYSAPIMIIAAGMVMLTICGEIDLSVGQVYAFSVHQIFYFGVCRTGDCRSGSR